MSENTAVSPPRKKRERGEFSPVARVLLDGPSFQQLPPIARHVFLTLKVMLGPSGIEVQYPDALLATLAHTTGWTPAKIATALNELEAAKWIQREAHVLWIVEHLRFHPGMSPMNLNHRLGVQNHVGGLPRLAIVRRFIEHYTAFFEDVIEPTSGFPEDSHAIATPMAMEGLSDHVVRSTNNESPSTNNQSPTTRTADAAVVRGAAKKNAATKSEPAEFTQAMQLYPKRAGANPRGEALRSWRARIAEGVEAAVMIEGTRRYRAYCEAASKIGTEYVQQAVRFFGKSPGFDESWDPPAAATGPNSRRASKPHPQQFDYIPTSDPRDVKWQD